MNGKRAEVWSLYGRRPGESLPLSRERKESESEDPPTGANGRFVKFTVDERDGRLTFGKHKGRLVSELAATEAGAKYLRWVLTKSFPNDFKNLVERQLSRRDK